MAIQETTFTPVSHDIWNILDEMGLELGLGRYPGESNTAYQTRLKSLVQSELGASRQGMLNAVSAFLGLDSYNLHGQKHFRLRYVPAQYDLQGNKLNITLTVDGTPLTQRDEDDWDDSSDGYIIWKQYDDTYGRLVEIKDETDKEIIVSYFSNINNEFIMVKDAFAGVLSESATADQMEIHELAGSSFIETHRLASGELSDEYYKLLSDINNLYKRTWGEFEWDKFHWDDGTHLNVIPTSFDKQTLPQLTAYNNGVGHGNSLRLMGLTPEGEMAIRPGYFYLSGYENYLFSHKHVSILDPDDHGGTLPDEVKLTLSYLSDGETEVTKSIYPIFGAPVTTKKPDTDNSLIIGYTNNYIDYYDPSDVRRKYLQDMNEVEINAGDNIERMYQYPVMTPMEPEVTTLAEGHTHTWTFNPNIIDTANYNGVTSEDPDGHYHTIVAGTVQSAGSTPHTHSITIPDDYGFKKPTPGTLRKRASAPESVVIPEDNDYFILTNKSDGVYAKIAQNKTLKHYVAFELDKEDHLVTGPAAPIINNNLFNIARTFVGIGADMPVKVFEEDVQGLKTYASRSSVKLNQIFGVSVQVNDLNNARFTDIDISVTAPSGTTLSQIIGANSTTEALQTVQFGHNYSDGTIYDRITIAATDKSASDMITLTVNAEYTTSADWDSLPGCADALQKTVEVDGTTFKTYKWTKQLEIRYDG